MFTKEQLIVVLNSMGLDVYETLSDVDPDNSIELQNFDEFCRFIKNHQIDTVYYHFSYILPECLQIDDDTTNNLKFKDYMIETLSEEIENYNNSVLKLDFSKPYSLSLYCAYQNFIYFIEEDDYWFKDEGFDTPEKAVINLADKYIEKIEIAKSEMEQKRKYELEKLRTQILKDEDFHKCTNEQLRRAYANRLFKDNSTLQNLFFSKNDGYFDFTVQSFIDKIWKEYKTSTKLENLR